MIRAVVFDLDNCLAAADEPGPELLAPTFDAIRRANHGHLPDDVLDRALDACWRNPLDWVARTFGFSDEMLAAGWAMNVRAEVTTPMYGYGDLDALAELPVQRFLVTSGFRRLQESKVRALGIASRFEGIYIDAIDAPGRKGKEAIFRDILRAYDLNLAEALIIGDSAESEIAAGNRIGMPTIQILRPGVRRTDTATQVIASLRELPAILRALG
jgi:putative hydrolase of the HAD superfamily